MQASKLGFLGALAALAAAGRMPKGRTVRKYEPSGTTVIAAAPPEHRRAAHEAQLSAKPNASASTRRKWARAAGIAG